MTKARRTHSQHAAYRLGRLSRPSRRLLLFGVLCLLTMPQSYSGGAPIAHPHALFQFWTPGGHLSADDHHGGGFSTMSMVEEEAMGTDHHPASHASTKDAPAHRLLKQPAVPTISQVTPASERSDMLGGILEPWFVLALAAVGLAGGRQMIRGGLLRSPEPPPPRFALAA